MAFNSIVIGAETYVSVGTGLYQLSTLAFGAPVKQIKLTPGKKTSKLGPTTASITRHLEKDVTVNGITTRKKLSMTLQISSPQEFTSTEISGLVTSIGTFGTVANIDRIMLGEN